MNHSILELMGHGGGAMWLILAFSVIAIGVAVERTIAQYKYTTRARALADTVGRCLGRGAINEARSACERSPSPLADVFLVGFERKGRVRAELVGSAVHRERQRVTHELRRLLWVLGTIGALSPFVGLAGTVIGIMQAMGGWENEATVKFSDVSGPIAAALIATAAGIIVAIEAVILFNFFSQRSARIASEMKLVTDEFLEQLLEEPSTTTAPELGQSDRPAGKEGKDGKLDAA
jgi:biopolymer transport protein ExbB/TolQ